VLLVDQNGILQSAATRDVTVPIACEWFAHDVTRVRQFVRFFPHDLGRITAIAGGLSRSRASPEKYLPCSDGLIERAAPVVARTLIGVDGPSSGNTDTTSMPPRRSR
jgi:hypothetical protein